jgi:PadR family transcriptional regulator, regulatory protein AphA
MSLSHALLGLLADRPASGYDLLKRFDVALAYVWPPARQSQIYAELGRLDEAGLIKVAAEGPRGRKEYALTEDGLAELRRWLTDVTPGKTRRNEAMMRVFFLGVLTREEAVSYLTGMVEEAARDGDRLKAVDESVQWDDSGLATYGHLVLEWGRRYAAMQREWAQWAAGQVAEGDATAAP